MRGEWPKELTKWDGLCYDVLANRTCPRVGTLWKKYFCGGLAYVLVAVDWVVRVHSTTHPQGMKKPPPGRLFVEARAFNYRDEASGVAGRSARGVLSRMTMVSAGVSEQVWLLLGVLQQVWLLLGVLQQWAPMAHWKPGWHL